jgi:hypothetical protein
MKKTILSFLMISGLFAGAQSYEIRVTESKESIGSGNNHAMTVTIYEAEYEDVEKEWKKLIKDYKSEKVKLSDHSFFADNVVIKEISTGTIDMYTNFSYKKDDKATRMIVACDLGVGYLNSSDHKDQYNIMKKIVYDFALKITKEAIEEQLKTVNKALKKLEEKQSDLEKDKKDMEQNIVNDKERIKKAEEDIKKNEDGIVKNVKEQEDQKKLIEGQKKVVEEVKKKLDGVN